MTADIFFSFAILQVQVYSSGTCQLKKTISRFKETVYSAKFRRDGQLLVAGGEEGLVKVNAVSLSVILVSQN